MRKNIGKSNYANNANNDSEGENKDAKKVVLEKRRVKISHKSDIDEESDSKRDKKQGKKRSCWQRKIE